MNVPIHKIDKFTNEFTLQWETVGGNKFNDKFFNETINMVAKKPEINRLFLGIRYEKGKDTLLLRHPKKDYMLNIGDRITFLFEDSTFLKLNIIEKSYLVHKSYNDTVKDIFETKIILFHSELKMFSETRIIDWQIETENRKLNSMSSWGIDHTYKGKEGVQYALFSLFNDYLLETSKIDNYTPLTDNNIPDNNFKETCFLYLMNDTSNGFYKIGISNSPNYRERTLQSEKPTIELLDSKEFPSRKIAAAFELALHKSYENKRIRGEWFELSNSDINEILFLMK